MINPNKMMHRADRNTRNLLIKQINGNDVYLVAFQESRRSKKKSIVYIYHIKNTEIVVFNRSTNGIRFMKIAIRPQNVKRFYETFVLPPVTPREQVWLDRYDYTLVN